MGNGRYSIDESVKINADLLNYGNFYTNEYDAARGTNGKTANKKWFGDNGTQLEIVPLEDDFNGDGKKETVYRVDEVTYDENGNETNRVGMGFTNISEQDSEMARISAQQKASQDKLNQERKEKLDRYTQAAKNDAASDRTSELEHISRSRQEGLDQVRSRQEVPEGDVSAGQTSQKLQNEYMYTQAAKHDAASDRASELEHISKSRQEGLDQVRSRRGEPNKSSAPGVGSRHNEALDNVQDTLNAEQARKNDEQAAE